MASGRGSFVQCGMRLKPSFDVQGSWVAPPRGGYTDAFPLQPIEHIEPFLNARADVARVEIRS